MTRRKAPLSLATLGDLRAQDYRVTAYCGGCRHARTLDLDALIDRLGEDCPYTDPAAFRGRLRCAECGSREVTTIVSPNLDHVRGTGAVG